MSKVFPEPIVKLPLADIPLDGVEAHLSQSIGHQILFMEFSKDVTLPEHVHESQWGVVLEGQIDIFIDEIKHTYGKGDRYFIPEGTKHSAKIYAGYADITFFEAENRYNAK